MGIACSTPGKTKHNVEGTSDEPWEDVVEEPTSKMPAAKPRGMVHVDSMDLRTPCRRDRRRRLSVRESFSSANSGYVQDVINLALEAAHSRRGVKALDSVLMKFTRVQAGFSSLRTVFEKREKTDTNAMCMEGVVAASKEVGLECPANIMSLMLQTEVLLEETKLLTFREFVATLAVVYLIQEAGDHRIAEKDKTDFMHAVDTVMDAFNFFDSNRDGLVEKADVLHIFNQETGLRSSEGGKANLGEGGKASLARFEEMDWNHSGAIHFTEFLFAFEGWVGLDEEDEEEEQPLREARRKSLEVSRLKH